MTRPVREARLSFFLCLRHLVSDARRAGVGLDEVVALVRQQYAKEAGG